MATIEDDLRVLHVELYKYFRENNVRAMKGAGRTIRLAAEKIAELQAQVERVKNVRVIEMCCGDEAIAQVVDYSDLLAAIKGEKL